MWIACPSWPHQPRPFVFKSNEISSFHTILQINLEIAISCRFYKSDKSFFAKAELCLLKLCLGRLRWADGGVVGDESIGFSPPGEDSSMHGGEVAGVSSLSSKQHLQGLKQSKTVRTKRLKALMVCELVCMLGRYFRLWSLHGKGLHHVLQVLRWTAFSRVTVGSACPGVMKPLGAQDSPRGDGRVP